MHVVQMKMREQASKRTHCGLKPKLNPCRRRDGCALRLERCVQRCPRESCVSVKLISLPEGVQLIAVTRIFVTPVFSRGSGKSSSKCIIEQGRAKAAVSFEMPKDGVDECFAFREVL